jgi:hypothetical protein
MTRMVDQKGNPVDVDLTEALKPKYPNVKVKITGRDGNAFMILGQVQRAMRNGQVPADDIEKWREEATSGDYDHLLQTCMKWVSIS